MNHGARREGGVLGGTARESRRSPGEHRARDGLNHRCGNSDLRREQSPEGGVFDVRTYGSPYRFAAAMALRMLREAVATCGAVGARDVRRATDAERRHGSSRGGSEGNNPRGASGMEQARRVGGGANRQEGERPCRRNVVGSGKPGGGSWTSPAESVEGEKTLRKASHVLERRVHTTARDEIGGDTL